MNVQSNDPARMQIRTLRDALDRAGRAALNAQESAIRAIADLATERTRSKQMEAALELAAKRIEEAEAENRRLRSLVGGIAQQKESLSRNLRGLLRDVRAAHAPAEIELRESDDFPPGGHGEHHAA